MSFFGSNKPSVTQIARLSPAQQQLQQGAIQQALSLLPQVAQQKGVNFAPIAQKARTQFYQNTIPSIAERFTALGGGARNSSGFTQALGSAGAGLEESLASMQAQYDFQNQQQMQNLLGTLLSSGLGREQFENLVSQRQPGFLESLLASLVPGLGGAISPILQAGLGGWGSQQMF